MKRIGVFLSILLVCGFCKPIYAQDTRLTLELKNVPLQTALSAIEASSNYFFLYSSGMIDVERTVTIRCSNWSITKILNELLIETEIEYIIKHNQIILAKRELSAPVSLEQVTVTGTVADDRGNLLPGANILIEGSNIGAIANEKGFFTISVPGPDAVIVVSYIGFITGRYPVKGTVQLDIMLSPDILKIDELTVTPLGIPRRNKSLTYAVQTIPTQEIRMEHDPDLVNALQGKIIGAVISQGSGGLGSATSLVLRGNRSLTGNSAALFVLDGIPMDNFNESIIVSDFGNGFTGINGTSTLNPDDIESITILRGASASALYGSNAADGVVLVNTKKGQEGIFTIDIHSSLSLQTLWDLSPLQNIYGQGIGGIIPSAEVINSIGSSWGAEMTGQNYINHLGNTAYYSPQPDNVKDFYQNSMAFANSIGITGGNAKTQTYLSYANSHANGMIPLNSAIKNAVNVRVSNQMSRKFSTDARVTYVRQQIEHTPIAGENNSPHFDLYQVPRSMELDVVKDYSSYISGVETPNPWPSTLPSIYQNPYWVLNGINISQLVDHFSAYLTARYTIKPWSNLQARASLERTFIRNDQHIKDGVLLYNFQGGNFNRSTSDALTQWYDLMLTGIQEINEKWTVDYIAGAIFNDYSKTMSGFRAEGLGIPNMFYSKLGLSKLLDNSVYHTRTNSVYTRVSFSYRDHIFIEGSFRNDWSSTLPAVSRSYPYGSLGVSAILSESLNLPESITFFKANLSVAQVGNGTEAYKLYTSYYVNTINGITSIKRDFTQANSDYKPEITTSYEGNIDIRFLKSRLGFEAGIYRTNSVNQIIIVSLPLASGFYNQRINSGKIQNTGIELIVNGTPLNTQKFKWDLSMQIAKNVNKLVELNEYIKTGGLPFIRVSGTSYNEGQPLNQIYVYGWETNEQGEFLVSKSGLPIISNVPKVIGNRDPKAIMSLSNVVSWRDVSLNLLVDGKIGGVFVSGNEANLSFSGISKATDQHRNGGWILTGTVVEETGEPNSEPVSAQEFWTSVSQKRYAAGEFFAYDATHFRLREASVEYRIPLKSELIRTLRISIFVKNLFWIYRGRSLLDIPGLSSRKLPSDPDMSLGGIPNGSDYGVLPSSRNYGMHLLLSF